MIELKNGSIMDVILFFSRRMMVSRLFGWKRREPCCYCRCRSFGRGGVREAARPVHERHEAQHRRLRRPAGAHLRLAGQHQRHPVKVEIDHLPPTPPPTPQPIEGEHEEEEKDDDDDDDDDDDSKNKTKKEKGDEEGVSRRLPRRRRRCRWPLLLITLIYLLNHTHTHREKHVELFFLVARILFPLSSLFIFSLSLSLSLSLSILVSVPTITVFRIKPKV